MQKPPGLRSGAFFPRLLIGFAACSVGIFLTLIPFAQWLTGTELAVEEGQRHQSHSTLYVSEADSGNVVRLDAAGSRTIFATNSGIPAGLAFDRDGNLFVARTDTQTIEKFDAAGHKSLFARGGYLKRPKGLAFDSDGNLYAADEAGNSIVKLDPFGNQALFVHGTGSPLHSPFALAFDANGNLYVTSTASNMIHRIDKSGHATLFAGAGLAGPTGLTFDKSGTLYVANLQSRIIRKFDSTGHGTEFVEINGDPYGIVFDSSQNLYVAANDSPGIQIFGPSGHANILVSAGASFFVAIPPGIERAPAPSPTETSTPAPLDGPAQTATPATTRPLVVVTPVSEPLQPGCVVVTATAGDVGPTSYFTLKAAFDAINAGTHQGKINIAISCPITESASAVLNASGTGSASFGSVDISPSGGSEVTISGSIAGALIDLNGADKVTIDGLTIGGNALVIDNTSATAAASTIRLIGDASNNTITRCTIKGAGASPTSGTIFFSSGSATGNISNTISSNTITNSGANFPTNALFSLGTSASISNQGSIAGNNIQDYFNATQATAGINLGSTGNSGWIITNNRLFQTATRIYTAANTHCGILAGTGSGYVINGNIIGYATSFGTGTTNLVGVSAGALGGTFPSSYTVNGSTANATRYIAINAAFTAGGPVSEIQGNAIAGFALYTSSNSSNLNGVWCGINLNSGNANIGTTTGNIIGATTGASSIYTATTTAGGAAVGINATSSNTVNIQNNSIGAVDAVGTGPAGGFTGIDTAGAGGVFAINNNTIGNTSVDNIRTGYTTVTGVSGGNLTNNGILTSTGAAAFVGIRNTATGATLAIDNNTFQGWATSGSSITVTGITSTGAVTNSVTHNGNFLGTAARGWIRYAIISSGALTGITKSGSTTATLAINGNDFQGIVNTSLALPGHTHTYINWSNATNSSANINGNTFTNLNVNTLGTVTFLNRATAAMTATGTESCNNNSIVTGFNKTGLDGAITFFTAGFSGTSANGSLMTATGNNFSNVATGGNSVLAWGNSEGTSVGNGPTKVITNNTFDNITGVGAFTGISLNDSGSGSTTSGNVISNIACSASFRGIQVDSHTCSNNSISSITLSTTSSSELTGIIAANPLNVALTISNNAITGLSSASSSLSPTVYGLLLFAGGTTSVSNNTITGLTLTGASNGTLNGIAVAGGNTTNLFKNTICNLLRAGAATTNGACNGMRLSGGTNVTASNNLIGDLRAPSTSQLDAIRGIAVTSSTVSSSYRIYDNTIYLNALSSGTDFGTSGIFHTTSATATTATLDLRNNIMANFSIPNGTGLTVAHRRSSTDLANYAATSNNNDLYAGTPGPAHLIFHDTINSDQSLASYKTRVNPRDSASINQAPPFLSTACGSTFLHINPTMATSIESGGTNITGIADDFDNDVRQGNSGYTGTGTSPDIGADEIEGTPASGANVNLTKIADNPTVTFGSQIGFTVTLTNSGVAAANGLVFTDNLPAAGDVNWVLDMANSDPGWSVAGSPPNQSLAYAPGTLAGLSSTEAHVISNTTVNTCDSFLNNSAIFISSNGGNGSASASVTVSGPASKIFFQNFDGVMPPALPPGWIAANAVNTDAQLWGTSNSGLPVPVADSLPNSAFINDPQTNSDKRLDSPAIGISSSIARLTFRNNYHMAGPFDGGVLEIRIGTGGFTDILAAGGSFVTGGYIAALSTTNGNPLGGRLAWTGTSGDFITTTVNLPAAAAHQSVQLRWRMGSASGGQGWRIDEVSVTDFNCPGAPTPTPAPTPTAAPTPTTPTPTPTPPPTASFLNEGFSDITTLEPRGWVMKNNSLPLGTTGWFQGNTALFPAQSGVANSYIAANYNNGSGTATISNWLITPPLFLRSGQNLNFWTRTIGNPASPDRLQVRMSLNGAGSDVGTTPISVGDFTTLLLDLNPTYTTTGYPIVWTLYSVPLTGLPSPTKGRLAVRYFVENGGPEGANSDYIGIDRVEYGGGDPTPTPGPPVSISGTVFQCATPAPGPLAGVTMTLTGSAATTTTTNASGNYSVTGLAVGGSYAVTPSKTARNPGSAGINTVDVLAVQRHFLAISPLTGCPLTAADSANPSGIDTIDVIAIQRFFLGFPVGTANVGKYSFSPLHRLYTPLNANQTSQNFDAVVLGDVAAPFANP